MNYNEINKVDYIVTNILTLKIFRWFLQLLEDLGYREFF